MVEVGLVLQQHTELAVRRAVERARDFRHRNTGTPARRVANARDSQPRPRRDPFTVKEAKAPFVIPALPSGPVAVILVIAGAVQNAVPRRQILERLEIRNLVDRLSVHKIARDHDKVGTCGIGLLDNRLGAPAGGCGTCVHVGYVENPVSVKRCRKIGERKLHLADVRDTQAVIDACGSKPPRQQGKNGQFDSGREEKQQNRKHEKQAHAGIRDIPYPYQLLRHDWRKRRPSDELENHKLDRAKKESNRPQHAPQRAESAPPYERKHQNQREKNRLILQNSLDHHHILLCPA